MKERGTPKALGAAEAAPEQPRSDVWPYPVIKPHMAGSVFELLRSEPMKWGWPAHFAKLLPSEQIELEQRQSAQPYRRACRSLATILDSALRDQWVRESEEVQEFVFMMQMVIEASTLGTIDHAYRLLGKAVTFKADKALKKKGEVLRAKVQEAWLEDRKAGKPDRGRLQRVQAELKGEGHSATAVREALVNAKCYSPRKNSKRK